MLLVVVYQVITRHKKLWRRGKAVVREEVESHSITAYIPKPYVDIFISRPWVRREAFESWHPLAARPTVALFNSSMTNIKILLHICISTRITRLTLCRRTAKSTVRVLLMHCPSLIQHNHIIVICALPCHFIWRSSRLCVRRACIISRGDRQ